MTKYLNIIPATALTLDKTQIFTYSLPKEYENKIFIGSLVQINFSSRKINGVVESFEIKKPNYKVKDILNLTDERPFLSKEQIEMAKWISEYYWVSLGLIIKTMLPKISPRILKRSVAGDKALYRLPQTHHIQLTQFQQSCIDKIQTSKDNKPFLLYGVASSGKTEVYLKLIEQQIRSDQQSIVLLPEISLTPQAIERYSARFGMDTISLLHSRLSYGKYFENYNDFRLGKTKILIGTRNAIFCPFQSLGLIVIDEEHDPSFKSWDMNPHFDSRDVAIKLSELTGAKLVFGTATPSIDSYYKSQNNQYTLLELPEKINQDTIPEVKIIDMKDEMEKKNYSVFSEELQKQIGQMLDKNQQGLLFINHRGSSSYILCRDCGYIEKCPRCDKSLSYYFKTNSLVCNSCGYKTSVPILCPKCKSPRIKFVGSGTQKIENELKTIFKDIRIGRLDADNIKEYETIYNDFKNKKIDIVIGTQMAVKNWDFPNLSLVGILNADNLLNIADFKTNEIAFSLIAQACGRTARPGSIGKQTAIIQTYNPNNKIIQLASQEKFKEFYTSEIEERRMFNYPPLSFMIKFSYKDRDSKKARQEIENLYRKLNELNALNEVIEIRPPLSSQFFKIRDKYVYELILKTKKWIPRTALRYPLEDININFL